MNDTIISAKEIEHLAALAKLELSNTEILKFQKQLSDILNYIKMLDEVDVSKVKTSFQIKNYYNQMSKDQPQKSLTQKEALQNAPLVKNNYFKVKKVL